MNSWWNYRAEPEGYDPYNHSGTANHALLAAMERAWKACVSAPSAAPLLIYPSQGFLDAYYEHLATPDRGHELEPYARA